MNQRFYSQRILCWVDVHICRPSVQGTCFTQDGTVNCTCWEEKRACAMLILSHPPHPLAHPWPLPSSPPHSKEEVVTVLISWVYSYMCARRTREYSDFLIIFPFLGSWCFGKGSMDFKAVFWWGLLVRVNLLLWGLSNLSFFIALSLFPQGWFSPHLQDPCSFTSVLPHY